MSNTIDFYFDLQYIEDADTTELINLFYTREDLKWDAPQERHLKSSLVT